jgi:hypothetical protein
VAYDDWTPEFQEIWDNLRADFEGLSPSQYEYTEYMFEEGFQRYEDEKNHPDDISFARAEFFDMIGEEYEDFFDWDGWREAMGY